MSITICTVVSRTELIVIDAEGKSIVRRVLSRPDSVAKGTKLITCKRGRH